MHKRFFTAALAASLALLAWPAVAQSYPAKPIKIVVPFPAGGTSDVLARLSQRELRAYRHEVQMMTKSVTARSRATKQSRLNGRYCFSAPVITVIN